VLDEAALAIELHLARYPAALQRLAAMLARSGSRNEHLLLKQAEVLERAGQNDAAQAVRRKALAQLEALPKAKRQLASNRSLASALSHGLRPARASAATAAPAPPQPN